MGAYLRRGFICKNECLGGGLFEGRAYLMVGAYLKICGICKTSSVMLRKHMYFQVFLSPLVLSYQMFIFMLS